MSLLYHALFNLSRVSQNSLVISKKASIGPVHQEGSLNSKFQSSRVGSENPNGDYPAEHYAALLRGLVHKLNNVLTVLTGHSGLLLLENGLPKNVKTQVRQMADSTAELSRYIDQAALITRPSALELKELPVSKLIVSLTVPASLSFSHSGDGGIVGDPQRLRSIFVEILENAVEARATKVDLQVHNTGERVVLRFRDNGQGIPPAQLSRVFDPFFTTQRQRSAFGLGLFKVRGDLQRMNGKITIDSDGQSYSEVIIDLPAA
jgi:signal transduction histidine kinase